MRIPKQLTSVAIFGSGLNGLRRTSYIWKVFLVVLVGSSCTRTTPKPTEDECLKHFIEKDLEAQLKLSQYNIPVSVESISGGSVKLRISATNVRPLPDETILAIRSSQSLRDIQELNKSVDILVKVEEAILKISRIKSVSWTAAEPCHADLFAPLWGLLKDWKAHNKWTFSVLSLEND